MSHVAYWLVGPALLATGLVGAQQGTPTKKNAEPAGAVVRLLDGSAIRIVFLQQHIAVQTDYGTLTVPVEDLVRIDFGVHLPDGLAAKIAQAIELLGHDNHKVREAAQKDLVGWGPYAFAPVHRATKSEILEVAKRAAVAEDKIRSLHPADNLRMREDDIVVTSKFTIVGRITTSVFKGKNEAIGEMNLELPRLRSIRWLNAAVETEVTVDAAKHGSTSNQWMDTGFEFQSGSRLLIAASGTVDLWPQGAAGGNTSGYTTGPKGYGGGTVVPAAPAGPGFAPPPAAALIANRPGTLLGKIGADGPPFAIGDHYEGIPAREGKLYLNIVPSPWNCDSAGSYKVKITPRHDVGLPD